MTAIHILICLTKGKSPEEIAKDFDRNIKLVCVWIDYMVGINQIYRYANDGTWVASDKGKEWIEKYYIILDNQLRQVFNVENII